MTSIQPARTLHNAEVQTLLVARWRIGAAAAAALWNTEPPRGRTLNFEITISRDLEGLHSAGVRLTDIDGRHAIGLACDWDGTIQITHDTEHALVHIDAPGLLVCTVSSESGQTLFARTPLFERLGIKGGRYEPDSIDWNG